MIDYTSARKALTGPVSSIRTPFNRDGGIDFDGLRKAIDFNIEAGSKTMLLTVGDSHYFALSDDEIAEVTRVTAEHTNGRAMVVAADRHYNRYQAVEFAGFCSRIGADVLMLMPPDWAQSCTTETLAAYYAEVARHIPVMIVTNVFIQRGEAFGLKTLELTLNTAENVVAIKDDMGGSFARKMALLVQGRWAVLSGGQKQNHMCIYPYGCAGYLSTFITFKPDIARRYWSAIEAGDISAATTIIRKFDMPFFDLISGMQGGFDAGIHGVLELFGICKRWRRLPYYSLSDVEMDRLAKGLEDIGIR